MEPRRILIALLFAIAAALPFLTSSREGQGFYFFEASITSDTAGMTQLFWDSGHGINEADSHQQSLRADKSPTVYRYRLPARTLFGFRYDIIDRPARVTFSNARIVDSGGKLVHAFAPGDFTAAHQIVSFQAEGETIRLITDPRGNDPMIDVKLPGPVVLSWTVAAALKRPGLVALAVFALALLASQAKEERLRAGFNRVAAWTLRHPRLSIVIVGLIAAVLQSHPVVFFGRSFASPNNGSLMLYDHMPALPGYSDAKFEAGVGSDVGALLFQHLYYPMVQHESVLGHGELPLWNRFNLCGVPLLGQGQSMFGDPLNGIVILGNGASWAWDLKFVLAHAILSIATGLTVWNLTRKLGACLFTALTMGFLGMYFFRLTHPATFSFCYGGLLLLAWSAVRNAPATRRGLVLPLLGLIGANWMVLTSGTVKEAYMTILCVNLAGLLMVALDLRPAAERLRQVAAVSAAGFIFVLLAAPLSGSFLTTLRHSFTAYDVPVAIQYPLTDVIGLFDEIFLRQHWADERAAGPSLNFLFLLGWLAWVFAPKDPRSRRLGYALLLGSVVPFAMAFGIVPASVIVKIPFIANLRQVGHFFATPLLLILAVLGGCGFAHVREVAGAPRWKAKAFTATLCVAALLALFWFQEREHNPSAFFFGYAAGLCLTLVAIALAARGYCTTGSIRFLVLIVLFGVPLTTWRFAQYRHTPFDWYVFNPGVRVDLRAPSGSVQRMKAEVQGPERVVGLQSNLFPSYHTAIGMEGLYGVDAVQNRFYFELARAAELTRVWIWDMPMSDTSVPGLRPLLDMLNVRHYLSSIDGTNHPIPGLRLVGTDDMLLFESPTVWPRAFFTDRVGSYFTPEELVGRLRDGDGLPLALVQGDEPLVRGLPRRLAGRTVVPATDYRLTGNTTQFVIQAPKPGVVVLTEAFYPNSFKVTVNGEAARYFRVNHAFKGIVLPREGRYEISFSYWPEHFTVMLSLFAAGVVALAAGVFWMVRPGRGPAPVASTLQ